MVLCIIALVIFSILGLFSAKYRALAKESFKCVFRKVMLKPCESGLEQRIRARTTAKLMRFPTVARFWNRNFQIISWIFVVAFFVSLFFMAKGLINVAIYGSCDPNSDFCIFSQLGNILPCGP